jgi:hypothetical protein
MESATSIMTSSTGLILKNKSGIIYDPKCPVSVKENIKV